MSLLTPKRQFSYPFSILQLVKSLPFYIPPARKGYPFRAEPPRIVHYRESPGGNAYGVRWRTGRVRCCVPTEDKLQAISQQTIVLHLPRNRDSGSSLVT